jgi:hypothetical protein
MIMSEEQVAAIIMSEEQTASIITTCRAEGIIP